jgi:hypothetical protein
MTNHAFPDKQEALGYIHSQFNGRVGYPLQSQFAEILGWHLEIYCSSTGNKFQKANQRVTAGILNQPLNGAGVIYLTCAIRDGLSQTPSLNGKIYVIGRREKDGKPIVSDSLWGILNFIWDTMDFYDSGHDPNAALSKLIISARVPCKTVGACWRKRGRQCICHRFK